MCRRILPPGVWAAVLLLGLVISVFSHVPALGWVEFDDTVNVTENPRFYPVTLSSVLAFWRAPYEHLYIPLSYTAYALQAVADRWLAGTDAVGPLRPILFHTVSVGLHALTTWMVWQLLRLSGFAGLPAVAGSGVFAIHPLQVESVAWVSEQRGLLSAACGLAALLAAVRGQQRSDGRSLPQFIQGTAWLGLALLAKPSAVTVPVLTWLVATTTAPPTRRFAGWMVCWLALAGVAVVVTRAVQPHGLPPDSVALAARAVVVPEAICFYVGKLCWPVGLCVAYGRTPADVLADPVAPWRAGLIWTVLAGMPLLPWVRSNRMPILIAAVPLLPVLGFVPFVFQNQSIVADRYAYLTVLGLAWGVAAALSGVEAAACGATGFARRRLPLAASRAAVLVVLAVLAALSRRQVAVWQDTGSLARQAVAVNAANVPGWSMLAGHELEQGNLAEAAAAARRSLALAPRNVVSLYALVAACDRLGDRDGRQAAVVRLEELGHSRRDMAEVFFFRGVKEFSSGSLEPACANLRLAAALHPDHDWATINLGVALTRMGRVDEAVGVLTDHASAYPQRAAVWTGLGNALVAAGKPGRAVECYTRSLQIAGGDPAVLLNRAIARERAGDEAGAEADRRRAARISQ